MDLYAQYHGMDVSHLSIDEVEYELFIRSISYSLKEHESIKRRKLKDQLKREKKSSEPVLVGKGSWSTTSDELRVICSKLVTIGSLLENPKLDARNKEKLQTRLVHYRVRISRLHSLTGAHKLVPQIAKLEKEVNHICKQHFPILEPVSEEVEDEETDLSKALEAVRSEIEDLNQSIAPIESDEAQSIERRNSQIAEKEKELDSSMKRTEEILGKLTNYENGEIDDLPTLLKAFKDFVVQTSDMDKKRRQREIERDQQKIRETEQHLQNKIRLEKLLVNLNDTLQNDTNAKDIADETLPSGSGHSKKTR